ncbi:hypothetical protein DN069_18510 [Streptacidiphilus pinicola]|uniref:Uncharacterized protein n=1 Tax=Streptacidiphilus pinicola TaxID=2219663 RepID=A0A2X0IKN7_9ACTN|nr:hypothetical protein DN069_18510 [Streptacidiphilus pinicola]
MAVFDAAWTLMEHNNLWAALHGETRRRAGRRDQPGLAHLPQRPGPGPAPLAGRTPGLPGRRPARRRLALPGRPPAGRHDQRPAPVEHRVRPMTAPTPSPPANAKPGDRLNRRDIHPPVHHA